MVAKTLLDVFQVNKYKLNDAALKSKSWFAQQAAMMRRQGYTSKRVMDSGDSVFVSVPTPGKLYMYWYDAKLKDELPYWDRFPLVFPFSKTKNGFIGINLHYIPYEYRIKIMDALMELDGSKKYTRRVKLQLSWELIKAHSTLKPLEPCVHRYLASQMRSPFKEVKRADWATAMLLPVEKFVGASKTKVWKDSKVKGGY